MFNTPFAANTQYTPFGFNGYQGFQGQNFQGFNPSWNQSYNQFSPFASFPGAGFQGFNNWNNNWNTNSWNTTGAWNSTPWNWNNQSFATPFTAPQSFNPYWNNSAPTSPWNWYNAPTPFAAQYPTQYPNQFSGLHGSQYPSPFGYNWWNNENTQNESATPFGYAPFQGFNPNQTPANQAA